MVGGLFDLVSLLLPVSVSTVTGLVIHVLGDGVSPAVTGRFHLLYRSVLEVSAPCKKFFQSVCFGRSKILG